MIIRDVIRQLADDIPLSIRTLNWDINKIREDFPILKQKVYGRPLIYFDNAATTQKPLSVIQALSEYYEKQNSNIHRGVHFLSQQATVSYEDARNEIRQFINADSSHEIIFTRGTTESINLVAYSFGKKFINHGDEIIISSMEHHSNIVPWQILCEEKKAILKVIPLNEDLELDIPEFINLLTPRTRLISIAHVSNALGIINPVKEIVRIAHDHDIPVLVDGAQGIPHMKIDVQDLDCDFYCFSAHKMYGPMGIGVLYGKEKYLEEMPPYQGGGEMIKTVSFQNTTFNELPFKFEAGTPNVGDVLGLRAAINYLERVGIEQIHKYETELYSFALDRLGSIDGMKIIGTGEHKTSVISFLVDDIHPYDAGTIIDRFGIAVRTGHHCAQPLMDYLGIPGTIRVSLALYNTRNEIDELVKVLYKVKEMFG